MPPTLIVEVPNPQVVGTSASQPSAQKKQKRVTFQDDINELRTNNLNTTNDGGFKKTEEVPNPQVVGTSASSLEKTEMTSCL